MGTPDQGTSHSMIVTLKSGEKGRLTPSLKVGGKKEEIGVFIELIERPNHLI